MVNMERIPSFLQSKTMCALEQMASFTQARQKVLAENIANVDTPGYQQKQVDLGGFQKALAEAIQRHSPGRSLPQVTTDQVQRDAGGSLVLRPGVEPAANIQFHDGTNGRIEHLMTGMSRNQLLHQISVDMLAKKYKGLENVIRGQTT
jgi:flagellar basal-body rod protein FlgB